MWGADRLLVGYQAFGWPVEGAELADGEPAGELTATLVRRSVPGNDRAVRRSGIRVLNKM